MLFMFRKFSTQSGLTDLQHASLEDKVWFDCREFTWHCLRFYILVSLCLLSCLSSYESRKPTSTPFHVLPTGETFFDVEAVICLAIIYFFRWAKNNGPLFLALKYPFFPISQPSWSPRQGIAMHWIKFPTKFLTTGKDQSTIFETSTLPTILFFRSSIGFKLLMIDLQLSNYSFLPLKTFNFW